MTFCCLLCSMHVYKHVTYIDSSSLTTSLWHRYNYFHLHLEMKKQRHKCGKPLLSLIWRRTFYGKRLMFSPCINKANTGSYSLFPVWKLTLKVEEPSCARFLKFLSVLFFWPPSLLYFEASLLHADEPHIPSTCGKTQVTRQPLQVLTMGEGAGLLLWHLGCCLRPHLLSCAIA